MWMFEQTEFYHPQVRVSCHWQRAGKSGVEPRRGGGHHKTRCCDPPADFSFEGNDELAQSSTQRQWHLIWNRWRCWTSIMIRFFSKAFKCSDTSSFLFLQTRTAAERRRVAAAATPHHVTGICTSPPHRASGNPKLIWCSKVQGVPGRRWRAAWRWHSGVWPWLCLLLTSDKTIQTERTRIIQYEGENHQRNFKDCLQDLRLSAVGGGKLFLILH